MLLKKQLIIDYRITFTRKPYTSVGQCSECKCKTGEYDCRKILLRRGIKLITYCSDSIIFKFKKCLINWKYVIIEEE